MTPMLYVAAFVAVLLAIEGLRLLLSKRGREAELVKQRLRALAPRGATNDDTDVRIVRTAAGVGWRGMLRGHVPAVRQLERTLYRAGMPTSVGRLLLIAFLLGGLGYAAATAFTDEMRGAVGLVAGAIPFLVVRRMATGRMRRLEEQLPEALELLTRSLRAGHGLTAGFHMVGEELGDPVGTEFGLVAEEVRLGLDLRDALENLVDRVDNEDLPYFTTAVLIQRQTGGNLAELLTKLSTLLRERTQFHGKVRALTAQGRGSALFLACWLPFITAVVWYTSPTYLMPLVENTWGHLVILGAVSLDLGGYLMARRIADVQH